MCHLYTFDGKFSTVQTPSNGFIPADIMKITKDNVVTGIQENALTSNAKLCMYKKAMRMAVPRVVPKNDAINIILRPNVSDNCVEHKQPSICIMPNAIAHKWAFIGVWVLWKISTVYVTNTERPVNAEKIANEIPMIMPRIAFLVPILRE